jgi:2-polyprenyl-6-methoxyphenol hydroxylase-like FAD-dependent oxidoreductase
MTSTPRRAVVIGASMAGLLAARVLHEHYPEVVLLERDLPSDEPSLRKGTPQAVHAHGLLARGRQVLDELFPGFSGRLLARGAQVGDIGTQVVLQCDGLRFAQHHGGERGLCASRPLIEAEVRRSVKALPGVHLIGGVDVLEPVHAGGTVTGVRFTARREDAVPQVLGAALVVDCSGRGSRSPHWLKTWGYEAPEEERVTVDVHYATAYFERDPVDEAMPRAVICTAAPQRPLPGVLLAQEPEGDGPPRWVITLGGYGDDAPLLSHDGMRRRAQAMGSPELAAVAARPRLRPLERVQGYAFPHSQRRHYERLGRFPRGFLVMGDALTSFNPIYGQGMTVAACEAMALRAQLDAGGEPEARRFFAAAAKVSDTPWQLAVGADLALPGVKGPRPLAVRIVNRYIARLNRAAVHDAAIGAAFARVMHLLAPPASLFAPRIAWRVWRFGGAGPRPLMAAEARLGGLGA